jgi:hypothetical protein
MEAVALFNSILFTACSLGKKNVCAIMVGTTALNIPIQAVATRNQNLFEAFEPEAGFRNPRHFYFTEILTAAPLTFVQKFLDRILPTPLRTKWLARNLRPYLERLLTTNSSRVEGDLDERVLESRRLLESEIRNQLKATYRSAEHALEKARVLQAEGAQAVQVELVRIDELKRKIEELKASPDSLEGEIGGKRKMP